MNKTLLIVKKDIVVVGKTAAKRGDVVRKSGLMIHDPEIPDKWEQYRNRFDLLH